MTKDFAVPSQSTQTDQRLPMTMYFDEKHRAGPGPIDGNNGGSPRRMTDASWQRWTSISEAAFVPRAKAKRALAFTKQDETKQCERREARCQNDSDITIGKACGRQGFLCMPAPGRRAKLLESLQTDRDQHGLGKAYQNTRDRITMITASISTTLACVGASRIVPARVPAFAGTESDKQPAYTNPSV